MLLLMQIDSTLKACKCDSVYCGFTACDVSQTFFRYWDGYRDRDRDYRRRSRSRSRDRSEQDGYRGRDKDYHRRSVSCSPDRRKDRGRGYDEERRSRSRSHGRYGIILILFPSSKLLVSCLSDWKLDRCWHAFPAWHSPNSPRSPPRKARLRDESPNGHNDNKHSPTSKSISPHDEPVDS